MGTTVSFLLMLKEEVPLFFLKGRVVDLNTTPAAAIASRRTGPDVFVDEYTTSIAPKSSKIRRTNKENTDLLLGQLCMLDNLRTIAFEAGMIRHRNEF